MDEDSVIEGTVDIVKSDDESRMAFGWAKIAVKKDGTVHEDDEADIVDIEELAKAAYDFVIDFRDASTDHSGGPSVGTLVESCVFDADKIAKMGLAPDALPHGWWVGFKLNKDTYNGVKQGKFKMFSIEGSAVREPVED